MPSYPGYYQNTFGANYLPQNNYGVPFMQPGYQNYQQMYSNGYPQQVQPQQNPAQQVQALNLGISQRNQNDYLVGAIRPCPSPAYIVPNPNAAQSCCGNNCGGCC